MGAPGGRIEIFKCFLRFWQRAALGIIHRGLHRFVHALVNLLADTFDLVAFLFEIKLEARNRIAALPFDQLFLVAVERRVVLAMPAVAISLALDQHRTFTGAGLRNLALAQLEHRKQVVARTHVALEAVGLRPIRDVFDRHLLLERRRVRVAIVLAHEDDRQLLHAGKVHRLMHVAARRRSLAEEGDRDVGILFHFEFESRADRNRQRRTEHRGRSENAMLQIAAVQKRILAAREPGLLAHQLRHQPARIDAAHDEHAHVAMERRDEVAVVQRRADAGDDRLLAGAGVNAAEDFVLAMQSRDALLERANQLHPVVELELVLDARSGLDHAARNIGFGHLGTPVSPIPFRLTPASQRGKTVLSRIATVIPADSARGPSMTHRR